MKNRRMYSLKINDELKTGDQVVFFTGKTKRDCLPCVIRSGVIHRTKPNIEIAEHGTGEIWRPYSQDIVECGSAIKGVKAVLQEIG